MLALLEPNALRTNAIIIIMAAPYQSPFHAEPPPPPAFQGQGIHGRASALAPLRGRLTLNGIQSNIELFPFHHQYRAPDEVTDGLLRQLLELFPSEELLEFNLVI